MVVGGSALQRRRVVPDAGPLNSGQTELSQVKRLDLKMLTCSVPEDMDDQQNA